MKWRFFLLFLAGWVSLTGASFPPRFLPPSLLKASPQPFYVVFEGPGAGEPPAPTAAECLAEEGLEEVQLHAVVARPYDPESLAKHREWREALALPRARWAVVLPRGRVASSRARHLRPVEIRAVLVRAGYQDPVQRLKAFLQKHPGHLDAREHLLRRLHQRAKCRTAALLGAKDPNQGGFPQARRLTPAQDLDIWEPYAVALRAAYSSGDWLLMGLPSWPMARTQREDAFPESASGMLQHVYRGHRTALLHALRQTPWDAHVLWHWLWTSKVLGEPLLPVLEAWPQLSTDRSGDVWPGASARKALVGEARLTGQWRRLAAQLLRQWQYLVAAPEDADQAALQATFPLRWRDLALPLLEACLLNGIPEKASLVFRELKALEDPHPYLEEAARLAERLGHREVATAWRAWTPESSEPPRNATVSASQLVGAEGWSRLEEGLHRLQMCMYADRKDAVQRAEPLDPPLLALLDGIRKEGLWKRAGWREGQGWNSSFRPLVVPAGLEPLASAWAHDLEEALVRRPSSLPLWSLWWQWCQLLPDRKLKPFLDRLVRDPLRDGPEEAPFQWPPEPLLERIEARAQTTGQWQEVVAFYRPLWERACEARGVRLSLGWVGDPGLGWTLDRLGIPLAAALLHQGHGSQADAIFQQALKAGFRRGELLDPPMLQAHRDLQERWQQAPWGR